MPGIPRTTCFHPAFKTWKETLSLSRSWLHTTLFRRKLSFSRVCCRLAFAVLTKATFNSSLLFTNSGKPIPFSYGCSWKNLHTLEQLKIQRKEEWIILSSEVLCVELDFLLFILTKIQHTELHSGYHAENHHSTQNVLFEWPTANGFPSHLWNGISKPFLSPQRQLQVPCPVQ